MYSVSETVPKSAAVRHQIKLSHSWQGLIRRSTV